MLDQLCVAVDQAGQSASRGHRRTATPASANVRSLINAGSAASKPATNCVASSRSLARNDWRFGSHGLRKRAVPSPIAVEPPHDTVESIEKIHHRRNAPTRAQISPLGNVHGRQTISLGQRANFGRPSVYELRAQLDGSRKSVRAIREDSPPDAITSLEHGHITAFLDKPRCRRKARGHPLPRL